MGRRLRRTQGDEHGFTLVEVLVTIILLGILFGIATYTWFGVVHSRQVDSATNQIVSDLRLANSKATNRLVPYQVVLTNNSSSYQFGPAGNTITHTLPDGVKITSSTLPFPIVIEFQTNGSVTGVTGGDSEIVIIKVSPLSSPQHGISIKPATARVNIDS